MQNCNNCGTQLPEGANVCPQCGTPANAQPYAAPAAPAKTGNSTLQTIAKVFMVLACIGMGWTLIPLCWLIPMTVHYFHACRDGRPVGIGFKVASLLFVNLIAGIVMLCDN